MRVVAEAMESPVAGDDGESDEDESEDVPGVARGDQPANGERRPRRRGRRGGRRRRGSGPEDGLAGSIADELGPTSAPEAATAVADFDGGSYEPAPTLIEPEPASQPTHHEPAPVAYTPSEPVPSAPTAPVAEETTQDDRAAARRRSTVREKVSFASSAPVADSAPAAVSHSAPEPTASPAPSEPAPAESSDAAAPRKAGWWSRRFGNGE